MNKCSWLSLIVFHVSVVLFLAPAQAASSIPHWALADFNWIEIRDVVPDQIDTILLPVGTLEAHGVLNNGADILVPSRLARDLAPRVNALIAPTIPYGLLVSLDRFPGTFGVSPQSFEGYCQDVLRGLAKQGFRNIIVLNGHGGNRAHLDTVSQTVARDLGVRTLVIDWWSYTNDLIFEVFGENGGHAGNNETAAVLAIAPELVHPELYRDDLAMPRSPGFTATPFPSSIILYTPEEGYPTFDRRQAQEYYDKVLDALARLIVEVREKWDRAGL